MAIDKRLVVGRVAGLDAQIGRVGHARSFETALTGRVSMGLLAREQSLVWSGSMGHLGSRRAEIAGTARSSGASVLLVVY